MKRPTSFFAVSSVRVISASEKGVEAMSIKDKRSICTGHSDITDSIISVRVMIFVQYNTYFAILVQDLTKTCNDSRQPDEYVPPPGDGGEGE